MNFLAKLGSLLVGDLASKLGSWLTLKISELWLWAQSFVEKKLEQKENESKNADAVKSLKESKTPEEIDAALDKLTSRIDGR